MIKNGVEMKWCIFFVVFCFEIIENEILRKLGMKEEKGDFNYFMYNKEIKICGMILR